MKQRLHKIIARSTELSLRKAETEISKGNVTVNGRVVTALGSMADPEIDVVKLRGKKVGAVGVKIYLAYYKPRNVIVSKSDPEGRETIWEDLEKYKGLLNSAGRLDYDSEGLLILTNDGDLINRLTHPRHEMTKDYLVKVNGFPVDMALDQLRAGIRFRGVAYSPAKIRFKSKTGTHTWFDVTISEGKNRQVRNMFEAVGHDVLKLKRVAIGEVRLSGLQPGEFRHLSKQELKSFGVKVK